jgi:hypothetical protein
MTTTREALLCQCVECVRSGHREKLAEIVRDTQNGDRLVVRTKRHGEQHTAVVLLDFLSASRTE